MQKTLLITGASRVASRDPDKAAGVIMDLVTLDEPPVHLLLGSDALALVKPALRTALDEIDFWEKVSRSTDFKHP